MAALRGLEITLIQASSADAIICRDIPFKNFAKTRQVFHHTERRKAWEKLAFNTNIKIADYNEMSVSEYYILIDELLKVHC